MRPVRLELKGFSAFRETTVLDFRELDLVAFVGPTGAGKSTIIDGIIFALYGSVVRYKSTNLVAPVINQLSTEARVRLDFVVDDLEYTAVRVVRRTAKGATTKEARLERGDEVLAGNARELDDAVEALLGLDFDQFTKTVVLPQGEFARFLTESAESRQSLLRRLLGMELFRSMGSAARDRARTAETKRQALDEQRSDREPVTDETLAEAGAGVTSLEALRDVLAEEVSARDAAERDAETQRAERDAADEQLAALTSAKTPAAAGRLEAKHEKIAGEREKARVAAEAAHEALVEAVDAVDTLPDAPDLERLLDLHTEAAELATERSSASKAATAAGASLTDATDRLDAMKAVVRDADEALATLRMRAGAAGLVDLLEAGKPCPLCDQPVATIPHHDHDDALAAAEAAAADAATAVDAASDAHRETERESVRAEAELDAIDRRAERLAADLSDAPDLRSTTAQLRDVRKAEAALDKARTRAESALAKVRAAEDKASELDAEAAELRRALIEARDRVMSLDPPPPSGESIAEDWSAFVAWSKDAVSEVRSSSKAAAAGVKAAEQTADAHRRVIADLCAPYDEGSTPEDPVAWLAAETGRAQARLEALEAERAAQAKTAARIDELTTEATVAGELGRLLNARGFEQWLMTDVMHDLAERATVRLLELSGGAYSLLTDGTDFSIRDHRNADETRGARTLSGGETFLASLSLALALSDSIADLATEGAPEIGSMFLDEGFGTLDPETLDVVATAIEELGAHGRMIGVVTHIRELADRIPVRFEIARTPSGSTVNRVLTG